RPDPQARQGPRTRVSRRCGGSGHGGSHRAQRQDATNECLQYARNPAGPPGGSVAAASEAGPTPDRRGGPATPPPSPPWARGFPRPRGLVPSMAPATDADWDTEYLDLILSVKIVDDLDAAIRHIRAHGTGLAEAIVTNDLAAARRFTREVDAAAVLVNASTR